MRSLLLPLFAVVAVGCSGTAPPVTPLPIPTVVRAAPPPDAVPVAVVVETVQVPITPPPTPELRISRRSVYEQAGVTEWVLENDLVVVYVQRPVEGYHARVVAPTGWMGLPEADRPALAHIGEGRWGPLSGRLGPGARVATGTAESPGAMVEAVRALFTSAPEAVAAFDAVAEASPRWGVVQPEHRADHGARRLAQAFGQPEVFTVVLVGSIGPEWVEPLIAEQLFVRRGGGPEFGAAEPVAAEDLVVRGAAPGVVGEWDVGAGWDDVPALLVLDAVLASRVGDGQTAAVTFDAARGAARLRLTLPISGGEPDLRTPISAAEVDTARRRAATEAATAYGQALAVADLWALPGQFRPPVRPEAAADLPAAIARTPSGRVDDLLRRLLASPSTAGLTILTSPPDAP